MTAVLTMDDLRTRRDATVPIVRGYMARHGLSAVEVTLEGRDGSVIVSDIETGAADPLGASGDDMAASDQPMRDLVAGLCEDHLALLHDGWNADAHALAIMRIPIRGELSADVYPMPQLHPEDEARDADLADGVDF